MKKFRQGQQEQPQQVQQQAQLYCPILVGDYDHRFYPVFSVQNRGNGVAMGVQVIGSYPASGPRGGTVIMNRTVAFFDKLGPSNSMSVQVQNPIAGEVYSATVSACVPKQ
jgi:hypothetical protein